jgi:hypothetical protein
MNSVKALFGLVALCSVQVACTKEEPAHADVLKPAAEPAKPASAASPVDTNRAAVASLTSYPSGYALVGRAAECRVSMLGRAPTERWEYVVGDCGGVLNVAVAPNSTAFARSATELIAFAPDGKRAWTTNVDKVQPELSELTVTLDSMVIAVSSPNTVVAFRSDGTAAWTFKLEGEEHIASSPHRSEAEGALVTTNAAVYALGADGAVRWRNTLAAPTP